MEMKNKNLGLKWGACNHQHWGLLADGNQT
jgi:hypothetical protein